MKPYGCILVTEALEDWVHELCKEWAHLREQSNGGGSECEQAACGWLKCCGERATRTHVQEAGRQGRG